MDIDSTTIATACDTAESVRWRINSAGYVEGRSPLLGNIHSVRQHRWIASILIGKPVHPDLHIHHINGCKTDNRPGNLMVVSPGPHGWETSLRAAAIEEQARLELEIEQQASGGRLSQFGQQLKLVLDAKSLQPDETSWQRTSEHGFWSEGDIAIAATEPIRRYNIHHPPTLQEIMSMPEGNPDKKFLKALHIERTRRSESDAAATIRGGLR